MNNENNSIGDSLMNYEIKEEIIDLPFDHIYAIATQNIDSPPTNFLQTSTGYGFSEHSEHQSRIKEANFQNEMDKLSICLNANQKEIQKLKNLALVHLDLIQKQNDLIIKRDKLLSDYKSEIEMLKMRLDRMEQRSDTQIQGPPPLMDMRPTVCMNRRPRGQVKNSNPPPLMDMRPGRVSRRAETQTQSHSKTRQSPMAETSSSSSDISVGQPCPVVGRPWTHGPDDSFDQNESGSWWLENHGSMYGAKRTPELSTMPPNPYLTRLLQKASSEHPTEGDAPKAGNPTTKTVFSYNKKKKDTKNEPVRKNSTNHITSKSEMGATPIKSKIQTVVTTPPQHIWDNAIRDAGASKSYCKSRIRRKNESKLTNATGLLSTSSKSSMDDLVVDRGDKKSASSEFCSDLSVYKYDAQVDDYGVVGMKNLGDASGTRSKMYGLDGIKPYKSTKALNAAKSSTGKGNESFSLGEDMGMNEVFDSTQKKVTPPYSLTSSVGSGMEKDLIPKTKYDDVSKLCTVGGKNKLPKEKTTEMSKCSNIQGSKKYTHRHFGLVVQTEPKRLEPDIFDFQPKEDVPRKHYCHLKKNTDNKMAKACECCSPEARMHDSDEPDEEDADMVSIGEYDDYQDDASDDSYAKIVESYNPENQQSVEKNDNNNIKYLDLSPKHDQSTKQKSFDNVDRSVAEVENFKARSVNIRNIETSCRDFSYGESSLIGSRFQSESVKPFDIDCSSISPIYALYTPERCNDAEKSPSDILPANTPMSKESANDLQVKSQEPKLKRSNVQEKCAPRKRAQSTNSSIVTRSRTDSTSKYTWASDLKKSASVATKPLPPLIIPSSYSVEGDNAPSTSSEWHNKFRIVMDNEKPNLEVPKWRIVECTDGAYCSEPEENVEDYMYAKRHLKMELEEKRIKRWDIQRLKEQNLLKKLKDRQEKINSGGNKVTWSYKTEKKNPRQTSWPSYDDLLYIEITDTLPTEEFGEVAPELVTRESSLPRLRSGAKKRKRRTISKRKGKATVGSKVPKNDIAHKVILNNATEEREENEED